MKAGQLELFNELAPATRELAQMLNNFGILISGLGGVSRLRGLILELAVRGRLVPPSPSDEPAIVTLKKVAKERERFLSLGGAKRRTSAEEAERREPMFAIPSGWAWAPVGELFEVAGGIQKTPRRAPVHNHYPYLRVENVQRGRLELSRIERFELFEGELARWRLAKGDLLIVEGNGSEAEIGRCARWDGTIGDCVHQNHIIRCRSIAPIEGDFTLLFLNSPSGIQEMKGLAITTSGLYSLSVGKIRGITVPVPPLAEQKRIVAKVDQLMALCDELEAKQTRKRDVGDRLTKAALGALTSAEGPADLQAAWTRTVSNFGALIAQPQDAQSLRLAVIELAMRGRLASSSRDDETVENLLTRIRAERRAAGTNRQEVPVEPETIPYPIPDGWRWVRWGDLTISTGSGWSPQCENRPRGGDEWGVLKVSAVSWFEFKPEENKALPAGLAPRPEFAVRSGDFLMSRANTSELVGRSVVVGEAPEHLILSDKIIRCEFSRWVEKGFVNLYNRTATARAHYVANASGTSDSMKNISRDVILSMPVPLAPLAEQRRIVARVEQLMKLCDDLESRLRARDEKAAKLAVALVAEAIA